ncbi:2,3-bisphosphoglycerate-independent phosphoglycerate mutase [Tepidanaerobacter syntrophicus]|uniref:2,3-bisphosphoglycerate-independent phosphoglycerate mutase n=2 Tax=Tepidanaerobacter syntrophicus TaxID=224999 RepID=A0A0U9HE71_9FIRM|nr:2,3-bisphosphoglycerate-independent phosphoglycerate mutase [Tepidanaerobacter syntrophicus]GAQ25122.1 2,3-bisphosphoglycerate-independent phosphoglycerate mutase [Tepidanaerobacter syntrophicus]GLI18609.1 2,3-bisphosphoglycerate-independent phosphoglycerate mutase [Tepidanaerobacter syntrophicus]
MPKKPLMLMILDGWGLNPKKEGNAILNANTPNYNRLIANYPNTSLEASGLAVGLPEGQMGNSEVGHLNMGAGRVVYQDFTRISQDIKTGDFFKNPALTAAMDNALTNGKKLHLMGLLSDGGVHSHIEHLKALLEMAKQKGLSQVYIHAFLDGRDVPPANALKYINEIEDYMKRIGIGKIATISGRYYAMDRDKRWDRTQKAYEAMVLGEGIKAHSATEAVEKSYERNETDEFVKPTVIVNETDKPIATVEPGDSIIFFNFRPDRARQITYAFCSEEFQGFERKKGYFPVFFVCMTEYDATIKNVMIAYGPESMDNILAEVLERAGIKQLRIAETEKYAHVTFFFNGGREKAYQGEDRILIPSPKVATYDLKPEMSAYEVADTVIKKILEDIYDVIVLNFANPDMVGHTGILEAAVKAVETVDKCVGMVADVIAEKEGTLIVTADHGNAEQMLNYETGEPYTAHTCNPVPFILVSPDKDKYKLTNGKLADIAPTMLELLGIAQPKEMTGKSLILH